MLKRLVFSCLFYLAAAAVGAEPEPFARIAFGSCLRQNEPQPVWEAVLRTQPQLFIFMGDNVYADTENPSLLRAAYETLNANQAFQAFRATVPVVGTWDDHDYGRGDAGADFPMKQESQQAFLDFFQVPVDSPRRERQGIYHAELYGPAGRRVQVILLDTRYHRSALRKDDRKIYPPRPYLPNTEPQATLLGRRQWNWLREQLLIPAEVRLIVSSIQVLATEQPKEKWANFPLERKNLLDLLRETNITNVIFLSGDRHFAEISQETSGFDSPIYDVTSSSLNAAEKPDPGERNARRVGAVYDGNNFGLLEIDWTQGAPRVAVQIRDEDGHIRLQKELYGY